MSAFIHTAAHDADEILSGFRSTVSDSIGVIETVTVLSVAAFLTALLNALI
ncbi:hypothetical protein [Niveispirillum sp.]|uniref:hypothetical protein n=1 Tax=Niveispirillum sp. TaxID=1917217 RepID=UPI001B6D7107|nr:hypothetical protein [Niveispirillum sp.]MBP7336621.1 hypothetical protein [Niveispirillum sp.]